MTKIWIALLVVSLASAACAAEDCASATRDLTEAVPFFSARGQKLRDLCAIPPPPIVKRALAEAEPPRTRRAKDWSSPFCRAWADAASLCAGTLGGGEPECLPRPNAETISVDKIVCVNADVEALKHGCAALNMTKDVHYTDGSVEPFDFDGYPRWSFSLAAHA